MVDDALFTGEPGGALDEKELQTTPSPDHLTPDSVTRERKRSAFREATAADPEPDAFIFSHTDADGLSAAALLDHYAGGNTHVQPVDYRDAYPFEDAIADLEASAVTDTPIYVSDFNANPEMAATVADDVAALADDGCPMLWFDHHQWRDDALDTLESVGVDVRVDEDECATSFIHDELSATGHEYPDHLGELAAVTKDIDLWIRDDPRSPLLNVYSRVADDGEYIDTVQEHGIHLPVDAMARIAERLERNERFEQGAIDRVESHYVYGDRQYDVAYTYTRGGRTSEIGNHLCEQMSHHIAVVGRPTGMSIYSHSDREYFARCHEVAGLLGGGGHPTASGFGMPVETGRDLAAYWASAGESVRDQVLDAIHEVVADE